MSWQPYIDDHLIMGLPSGNRLHSAAIIGHDGHVWAQSPEFPQIKDTEFQNIMHGFTDSSDIAQKGLYMGGNKYMVVQGEPGEVIRGKKGAGGACLKKVNTALVIGIYEEPTQPGEVNMVVEKLGDYLIEMGI